MEQQNQQPKPDRKDRKGPNYFGQHRIVFTNVRRPEEKHKDGKTKTLEEQKKELTENINKALGYISARSAAGDHICLNSQNLNRTWTEAVKRIAPLTGGIAVVIPRHGYIWCGLFINCDDLTGEQILEIARTAPDPPWVRTKPGMNPSLTAAVERFNGSHHA